MDYTKNYNLKKPSNEDFYNVEDFNSNVETVDTELKKVNDKADKIEKQQINKIELEEILSSQNILKKIKEVDGAGSGLDADLLSGRKSESYFSMLGEVKNVKDLSNKFGFGYIQPTTEGMPLKGHWWMVSILYGFIGSPGRLIEVTSLSVPNEKYVLRYDGATWSDWEKENIIKSIYVPTNSDLNTYVNEGFYFNYLNAEVATMKNIPVAESFALTVERHAGVSQTIKTYDPNNPRIFYRVFYAGNWSKWKEYSETAFLSKGFGNAGEINSMLQSGSDILAIKNSNGNYINGNFMGCNIINAPTAEWYFIKQIVHNDLWVNLQVLSFTDPNARWKENRMIKGVWQGWKEMEGMPICNIPRNFRKSVGRGASDVLFSHYGSPGTIKYIAGPGSLSIDIDGKVIKSIVNRDLSTPFPYLDFQKNSTSENWISIIDISFKNSCVIKAETDGIYTGLVMTAN